jgi:hypothetical protein
LNLDITDDTILTGGDCMKKIYINVFKLGIVLSFTGSIFFTIFYLPWFIDNYMESNQETIKYIYLTASSLFNIPFGYALLIAFGFLNLLSNDKIFSFQIVNRLRLVRLSGMVIAFIHVAVISLTLTMNVFSEVMTLLSLMVIVIASLVSTFIYLLETILSKASTLKEDNDLFI